MAGRHVRAGGSGWVIGVIYIVLVIALLLWFVYGIIRRVSVGGSGMRGGFNGGWCRAYSVNTQGGLGGSWQSILCPAPLGGPQSSTSPHPATYVVQTYEQPIGDRRLTAKLESV